jgi:pimeloyl-ACP methyl ester carboxylesterase
MNRPMPEVHGATHRTIEARGARFHVAEAGGGEPVVLLHGLAQHWYAWRRVLPELTANYRLYCIDLRGCGWSEGTRRGYSTRDQAADVLAVMDALGLASARLIAHGDSTWIGFMLCRMAPSRFPAYLALNGAVPWATRGTLLRHAWRFWFTALWEYPVAGSAVLRRFPAFTRALLQMWSGRRYHWDDAVLQEFAAASATPTQAHAIQQTLWQYVLHDIPALVSGSWRRAAPITVPTLLLGGELDPVSRPGPARDLTPHATDLRIELVPGAHLLPETAPRIVAAAARDHFE